MILFALTQVLYVWASGWSAPCADLINQEIKKLNESIDHEKQVLVIKDIKFLSDHKAFIIYDVCEKNAD